VKAVQEGRWGKVKALVYLLTHSFSGRAAAILRVTTNPGANTPGVDGEIWNTPEAKTAAFSRLRAAGYHPRPLRRVHIPKSSDPSQKRPLGIPTLTDRAAQALYLLALDPIVETQADRCSFGFRLGRSCADALERAHTVLGNRHSAAYVLEGDIKSCFDRISHTWLEAHVPMDRNILHKWLKAGFLDRGVFGATTDGTPQGGISSPALANRALDGLEALLRERFGATPAQRRRNKVHLIRYADDFLITGTSEVLLRYGVQPLVEHFLAERGLELSHEKTSITRTEDGFDFLGQHIRRYRDGRVYLKPSRRSVRTLLTKVRRLIREEGGSLSAGALMQRLNPIIRGWALYHRHAASKSTYDYVDRAVFRMVWQWARRRHDQKRATWVKGKYFRRVGHRHWVLTGTIPDRDGEPHLVQLITAGSIRIRRHVQIRGGANPYDPAWEPYFEERLSRQLAETLAGRGTVRYLWLQQEGLCPVCRQPLTLEADWHLHHRQWRVNGGSSLIENLELLHPNCHRQVHGRGKVRA